MKAPAIIILLVLPMSGCSSLSDAYSGSSTTASANRAGQQAAENLNRWNGFDSPVIDPRTGRLTLYHGG